MAQTKLLAPGRYATVWRTSISSVGRLKADLYLTCPCWVRKRLTVQADLPREKGPVWTLHFVPRDRSAHEMPAFGQVWVGWVPCSA